MPQIRLDRFISERGELTRSQIKELAAKGQIRVNGAVVKKSDTKIDPDCDEVEVQVRDRHSHEPLTTAATPSESADETDDNPVGETEV